MSTGPRAIVRHETWTLTPDREPDAAPLSYKMRCTMCEEESPKSEGWNDPQSWALAHSGKNPSHRTYSEVISRPWRTFMHA